MFSVFSDIAKPTERINAAKNCPGALYTTMLLEDPEGEDETLVNTSNSKISYVVTWMNKKILYELPNVKQKDDTHIWVRVRIAISMLNKLTEEGIIEKETNIRYCLRLSTNVRKILGEIHTEDLPF